MRRTRLFELARTAGLTVNEESCRVLIWGKEKYALGVAVYEDGSAHRTDVDLSITKNMTIPECAKLFDLV